MVVQGGEGTGVGSSGYWILHTGGAAGWMRITCGGPLSAMNYEEAKGVVDAERCSSRRVCKLET